MKLFIWRNTECNRLYSSGDIVAMAPDLDAAKAAVLDAARTATVGYTDMADLARQDWDTEERDSEIAAVLAKVRADLEKPPAVYDTDAAAFFDGGE